MNRPISCCYGPPDSEVFGDSRQLTRAIGNAQRELHIVVIERPSTVGRSYREFDTLHNAFNRFAGRSTDLRGVQQICGRTSSQLMFASSDLSFANIASP